jgi:hypothetical protein
MPPPAPLLMQFDWPHQAPNNLPPVNGARRHVIRDRMLNCSSGYDEHTVLIREMVQWYSY